MLRPSIRPFLSLSGCTPARSLHTSLPRLRPRIPFTESRPPRYPPADFPTPSALRPTLFALGLGTATYLAAGTLTNVETEKWTERLGPGSWWRAGVVGDDVIKRARRLELAKKLNASLSHVVATVSSLPTTIQQLVVRTYVVTCEAYLNSSDAHRTAIGIIAANTLVFALWHMPSPCLQAFMMRNFMHHPLLNGNWTLATSVFSHKSGAHFLFNMIALYSIGSSAFEYLERPHLFNPDAPAHPPEASSSYHFFSFYLAAGVVASLVSHIVSVRFRLPKLIAASTVTSPLAAARAAPAILPSLGASGAIYSCLAVTALAFPDAKVSIIFLPMFPVPISTGMLGLVGLDIIGILRGWKLFDHWAHLAGAAFGASYYWLGPPLWNEVRKVTGAPAAVSS